MSRQSYARKRIETLQKDKAKCDYLSKIGDEIKEACDIFNKHRGIESGALTKAKAKERARISVTFHVRNIPPPRKVYIRKQQDSTQDMTLKRFMIVSLAEQVRKSLIDKGNYTPRKETPNNLRTP